MQTKLLALLPALAFAAACQSTGDGWQAPSALVTLYDQATPDGLIELEFDRDGSLIELEADVAIDDLPEVVVAAAMQRYPSAVLTGAEREVKGSTWTWEVKFKNEGRAMELVVDDEGNVLEIERELTVDEAPDGLIAASERAVPGSAFVSIESIEAGDQRSFHVKRKKDGASYKIVLDEGGAVLRKVREARAEIEIPLAD